MPPQVACDYRHRDATKDVTMVEILFMAQLVHRPLQAMARRWYCRGLFQVTRGRLHCAECTRS
jgi:hypothetical protein